MKYYTGIGSRSTPREVLDHMVGLGKALAKLGYVLRSGAAEGADAAFEQGANSVGGMTEIYLPWPRFNGSHSALHTSSPDAMAMAEHFHPAWDRCSQGARKMHARNCHQVLGLNLDQPSEFILCWTPGGLMKGGTAQALRLAQHHGIPVHNLGGMLGHESVDILLVKLINENVQETK